MFAPSRLAPHREFMTSKIIAACLIAFVVAPAVLAQSDKVFLLDGTVAKKVRVTEYTIRSLRYKRGGGTESVESDQVAKIELGSFSKIYARGLRDAGMMLTLAREQLAEKSSVEAQLGFVSAARQFFDEGSPAEAVSTLNELEKAYPDGGAIADVYRLKFEYYIGAGPKTASSALKVAKKYEQAAIDGAWPNGFVVEASFFQAMATKMAPEDFQSKLRTIISESRGSNMVVSNRANVQLANSLRQLNKVDEAKRLYEAIIKRSNVDDSAMAGAYLGLGHILTAKGSDKEQGKKALLLFLRVRLETRDAWPSLQAEALYSCIQAARQWGGPESRYIMGRCRGLLMADFPNSEWAKQAR
jgi:tetratricopeptide (TPR) repeat protein